MCILAYLAASLAPTHYMPIAPPPSVVTTQTVSKHGHMSTCPLQDSITHPPNPARWRATALGGLLEGVSLARPEHGPPSPGV